jgi:hypothetical protein
MVFHLEMHLLKHYHHQELRKEIMLQYGTGSKGTDPIELDIKEEKFLNL